MMEETHDHHDINLIRGRYCYQVVASDKIWQTDKETLAILKGLPIQLRTQGLMVTLAFLMTKKSNLTHVVDLLACWLLRDAPYKLLTTSQVSGKNLLVACASKHTSNLVYLSVQKEAILLAEQAKLYAVALEEE